MCLCSGTGSYRVSRFSVLLNEYRIVEKTCACASKTVAFAYGEQMRGAKIGGTVYAPIGAPRTPLSKASEALQRHAQRVGL